MAQIAIMRALGASKRAVLVSLAVEYMVRGGIAGVFGGVLGCAGTSWILYPLGLTAGWISYLGYHAVHEEWKRCGAAPAFVSALTGVAGAAAIQRGAESFFR